MTKSLRAIATDVALRPVVPADEGLLRTLFRQNRPDLDALPEPARSSLLDLQFRAGRVRRLSHHPESRPFVVLAAGEPVGALVVERGRPTTWIMRLAIEQGSRRQGVASAAVRAVLDATDGPVGVHIPADDHGTRELLEALGFESRAPRVGSGDLLEMIFLGRVDAQG